jgi:hypothetical protein
MKHPIVTVTGLGLALGLAFFVLGYAAADDEKGAGWGTIKGRVVFDGDAIPEPKKIDVNKDAEHCLSKGPLVSDELVVNKKNRGVRWAFVWLVPETGGPPLAIHPSLQKIKDKQVELDQPCCMFVPHALAVREGQDLVAKNSAPINHNVHWISASVKNPGDNKIVPAKQSLVIKDLKADPRYPIVFSCDIHGWMKAYVRVFDHPYFAITDEDGKFEIKLAPAGKYRLISWQESVGFVAYDNADNRRNGIGVTIKANGTTDVGDLKLKLEK